MKSIVASMASESSQQKVENRSHLFSGQRILQKLGTLLLALWLLAAVSSVWAAPYSGKAFTYSQPDGSSLQVKLYGDEFFAYQRTLDGYEVVRDAATGYVCYAKLSADGTAFESTGIPAVTAALSGDTCRANALATGTLAPAYTSLPEDVVQERIAAAEVKLGADTKGRRLAAAKTTTKATGRVGAPPASETTGSVVGLCVLVKFKDDPTTVSVYNSVTSSYDTLDTTISQTQVDNFCNGSGYTEFGNACSVNEYFSTQSNGYLNYTNRVLAYVTVPHARSYYDNNSAYNGDKFVTDAMEQVRLAGYNLTDVTLDTYGRIVALNVFYTGTVTADWSYGLWPSTSALSTPKVMSTGITAYAYQMSDMTNELKIGTFCHENGHLVCDFPDLYSYYDSAFICGYYSLMSGGNYGGPSSDGSHPTNIDPYLKYKAGWADVVEVTSTTMLTTSLTCDVNAFYKYTNPNYSTEYFLVENRCNTAGYEETYGPGNGLVVWHINEAGDNTYSSLYYGTYTIPYEAFVVEATPTTLISPWYLYPDVDEYDTFCAERGYDALYDGSTTVSLQFWDHSTNYTGLTVDSGFALCEFGAAGSTTSFYIGAHPKIDSFYLDAGATTADDPVVTLNCVSEGNPAYYRASEYADFRDAQLWQPYSSTDTTTFTLSAGTASKRVYFQLKSSINGLSSIVSDTIMFYMPVLSAFTINKGDAITTVQTVTLNNVCTMSTASEYLASERKNFSDKSESDWKPYSRTPSFELSPGNGKKTVYLKARNGYGKESNTQVDTIQFVGPAVKTLRINNGAAATTTRTVTLNNTCTVTSDSLLAYAASEDKDFTGVTSSTYSTAPTYYITSAGDGVKTIYFKVWSSANQVSVYQADTIILNVLTLDSMSIASTYGGDLGSTVTTRLVTLPNTYTAGAGYTSGKYTKLSVPVSYMASESPTFKGAGWKTYSSAPSFTLSANTSASNPANKTVYFKLKNIVGQTCVTSATVTLDVPILKSVAINDGATSVSVSAVTLTPSITGTVSAYMVSESSTFSVKGVSASWIDGYAGLPVSYSFASATAGTKRVYFKVKNAAGTVSTVVNDTIKKSGNSATAPTPVKASSTSSSSKKTSKTGTTNSGGTTTDSATTGVATDATKTNVTTTNTLSLSAGALDFGTVALGAAAQQTIILTNNTNAALTISGITYPDGFTGDWTGGTLAVGASQSVVVTFAPSAEASYSGSVAVASDKPAVSVAVQGVGAKPVLKITDYALSATNVKEGDPFVATLTISNESDFATGKFHVALYLLTDDTLLLGIGAGYLVEEVAVDSIAAQDEALATWNFAVPALGDASTYSIWPVFALEDSQSVITTFDVTKNMLQSTSVVTVAK